MAAADHGRRRGAGRPQGRRPTWSPLRRGARDHGDGDLLRGHAQRQHLHRHHPELPGERQRLGPGRRRRSPTPTTRGTGGWRCSAPPSPRTSSAGTGCPRVGKTVQFNGIDFTVSGVLAAKGSTGPQDSRRPGDRAADRGAGHPDRLRRAEQHLGQGHRRRLGRRWPRPRSTAILDARHKVTSTSRGLLDLQRVLDPVRGDQQQRDLHRAARRGGRDLAARRRDRRDEHHAGHRHRADPGDRHPQGDRRPARRHRRPVPAGGGAAVAVRRGDGRAGRPGRQPVHHRRRPARGGPVLGRARLRGGGRGRAVLRALPGQPRGLPAPHRRAALRVSGADMDFSPRRSRNGSEDGPQPDAPHGVLADPAGPEPTAALPPVEETVVEERVVEETDDYDEDADLLPAEARSPVNRWTIGLIAAVLMVGSFGAGAYAQRGTGSTDQTTAAGGLARPGGTGRQGGYGQFGGGGFGGQAPGGAPGTGQGAAGSGQGAAATPVVVGQVVSVSGSTLTVKNFAGATVKVTVPEGTAVSVTASTPLAGLKAGTTVSVSGTKGSDGSVTATGVTARAAAR